MDGYFLTVLVVCIMISLPINGDVGIEPKCLSRFDYDEKMLMKLLKIYDMVEKFDTKLTEYNIKLDSFDRKVENILANYDTNEQKRQATIDEAITNLNLEQEEAKRATLEWQAHVKRTVAGEISSSNWKRQLVAFTATSSETGPRSGLLKFTTTLMNVGNAYDISTGEFTCPVSGVYYFIFHLVKKRSSSADAGGCYLGLNGENLSIRAYIDPQDGQYGADNGSYGVSNSAFLRLSAGDKVRLQSCSGGSDTSARHDSQSSFSGYLVTADA